MRQDVLALTRRAFEQDQVPQLLKGGGPLCHRPRSVPARGPAHRLERPAPGGGAALLRPG